MISSIIVEGVIAFLTSRACAPAAFPNTGFVNITSDTPRHKFSLLLRSCGQIHRHEIRALVQVEELTLEEFGSREQLSASLRGTTNGFFPPMSCCRCLASVCVFNITFVSFERGVWSTVDCAGFMSVREEKSGCEVSSTTCTTPGHRV